MYLSSSAASSAFGLVAVATRLPACVVFEMDGFEGWLFSTSLLTRSWIPTNWAFASNTAPVYSSIFILPLLPLKTLKNTAKMHKKKGTIKQFNWCQTSTHIIANNFINCCSLWITPFIPSTCIQSNKLIGTALKIVTLNLTYSLLRKMPIDSTVVPLVDIQPMHELL